MFETRVNFLKTRDEAKSVARLHRRHITPSFLTKLGEQFLIELYDAMIGSRHALCLIAKEDGKVIGFIAGSSDLTKFYKDFQKKKGWRIAFLVLKKSLNSKLLWGVIELLCYPKRICYCKTLPKAELIAVTVDPSHQNKGCGSLLIKTFFEKIKVYNVNKVKVIIDEENRKAISYYENHGFIKVNSFFLHRGIRSYIFVKEL